MPYVVFLALVMLPALGLVRRLGGEDPAERVALALLVGFSFLIGGNWLLAIAGLLMGGALWVGAALSGLAGAVLLWRTRAAAGGRLRVDRRVAAILALPMMAALYVIFRGSVVPAMEFDALTYHFPRAVEILRAHTIPVIPSGDFRVAYFPWNYELLLADSFILVRGDAQGYWIGLLATAGIVACAGTAFRQAWPRATKTDLALGMVLVASCPILLLHAGANKNDALFGFFLLSALHWTARWAREGGRQAWFLALLSLVLGFGTKSTALFLLPVMGIAAWRFRAKWPFGTPGIRGAALGLAGLATLLVLSGSAWPLLNLARCGHPLGETAMVGGVSGFESNAVPNYLGFSNFWKFPLLVLLRPFSSNSLGVWVFWEGAYWYWPSFNSIYGHFGWLCSALVLLVPLGLRQHRTEAGGYRLVWTWLTLGYILFTLPQGYRVDGMFATFPRYLLCIPVLVALWTVLPALQWMRDRDWSVARWATGLGLAAYFLVQAAYYLTKDVSKSLDLVVRSLELPGQRPNLNIESVVDQLAGPDDPVAFDSGYGGFVYPLYGAGLTRPLVFLPRRPGPIPIPPGVKWVVIDRSWNVGWSHPGATTMAEFMAPLKRGEVHEDLTLVEQMKRDPEFAEVVVPNRFNQWAFVARKLLPQEKR